jgi:hypothetical protein
VIKIATTNKTGIFILVLFTNTGRLLLNEVGTRWMKQGNNREIMNGRPLVL